MIYHHAAYVFSALLMGSGLAAQPLPDANKNMPMHQAKTVADKARDELVKAESDLTGYWQQGDGEMVSFQQEGSNLTSRYRKRSVNNDENDIDFTATIHGNLIYGAHRGPFSRAMQKKCALQIWVGMGLSLNDEGTELTGFRGDRVVDPKTCSAKNSDPVKLVYRKIADIDSGQ